MNEFHYFRPYFTATVFAKLQQGDPHGRVSIMSLFNYAMRKVWFHQTRIGLSLYDVTGQGYLRETVSTKHGFFYINTSQIVYVLFCEGLGKLHIRTYSDFTSVGRTGKIFP